MVGSRSIGMLPIDRGGFGSIGGSIQSTSVLWEFAWIDRLIDPGLFATKRTFPIDPLIDWDLWIDPRIDPEALCSLGQVWIDPLIDPEPGSIH